jgi:hypothetical protein
MNVIPPLRTRKSPLLAGLIGFATSGLGLILYFWSFVDSIVLLGLGAVVFLVFGDSEFFFSGMLIGALYGYLRASSSNRRLGREKRNND